MSADVSPGSEIRRARQTLEIYYDRENGDFRTAIVATSLGIALEGFGAFVEATSSNPYISAAAGVGIVIDGLFMAASAKEVRDTYRYRRQSARDIKEFDLTNIEE